jgi:hypothetical protein
MLLIDVDKRAFAEPAKAEASSEPGGSGLWCAGRRFRADRNPEFLKSIAHSGRRLNPGRGSPFKMSGMRDGDLRPWPRKCDIVWLMCGDHISKYARIILKASTAEVSLSVSGIFVRIPCADDNSTVRRTTRPPAFNFSSQNQRNNRPFRPAGFFHDPIEKLIVPIGRGSDETCDPAKQWFVASQKH